jgi:N-acetylglutamate synthase-like GNAT family acetyltransferase
MIRPAAIGDLGRVKGLLLECDLPVDGLDQQFGEAYCVAEHDGQIIGAGGIEVYGSHGLLRSVAVLPTWRGKSIGHKLIIDRLAWAESRGLTHVFLLTTTAAQYFERFGFRSLDRGAVPPEIKKSSEFSSICPESAIVMVRSDNDSYTKVGTEEVSQ